MPLLGPKSGEGPFRELRSLPADHYSLPLSPRVSCCVNGEVKARKFADGKWSCTCTLCPGAQMREPLAYGLLLIV
eukprot:1159312-Pelagomonas_calceolata.AAC.4